jgi:glycosyltransferase involved in cell wall biosynthesis
MIITFPVLAWRRPNGGAMAIYEFANAMCRRGHSVHIMHMGWGEQIGSLDDLPWMNFEDGIEHIFLGAQGTSRIEVPPSDIEDIVRAEGFGLADLGPDLPEADFIAGYDEQLPSRHGLPFLFVQGYRIFVSSIEDILFRAPCPKVCIASWLVEAGKQLGVPDDELVYVPNGLKHEKYRLVSPIKNRPPLVSAAYRNNPQTRPDELLAVLAEVKTRIPEVEATVFSPAAPVHATAPWMTVVTDPPQEFIVTEIYNRSRIYLNAGRYEGFGFPCVEAMACGAALVTTANGGSDEYAIHEETALVCEPDDVTALVDNVERLLIDDELRIRLANQGMEYVRRTFDWDASAEKLETFLNEYAADPGRYQQR